MSQRLNDLANGLLYGVGLSAGPTVGITTTGITGPGVNMITGDGNCYCLLVMGTITGATGTLAVTIQQSPNGTSAWTALANIQSAGTTVTQGIFPVQTTGVTANVQAITFQRDMQWLRAVGVLSGVTIVAAADVIFIEQLKNFGG